MKVYYIVADTGLRWGNPKWGKSGKAYHSEKMARSIANDTTLGGIAYYARRTGISSYSVEEYEVVHTRCCMSLHLGDEK